MASEADERLKKKNMKPQKTTARPPVDLDATDEFPVLDAAAYEAEVVSRESAEPADGRPAAAESRPSASGSPPTGLLAANAAPPAADSDDMLAVEQWIAQKADELRSQQEAAQRSAAESEAARGEVARLTHELADVRAAETRQNAALAASRALLERRSGELQALQHAHAALIAEREHLAAEITTLQAQLANCVESLQSRESYRAMYESSLQELELELAAERDEGEQQRRALSSRLAELTANHADGSAQLRAMQAALTAAQQRAQIEALASAAAVERQRELESSIASRQAELTEARLEIERNRALVADLTAAVLKSQAMFSEQGRLLEEREAAASAMAASHAEQTTLITALRAQVEELKARLAMPDTERRALEERVTTLTKEAAASHSRLTHVESLNSDLRATVGQLDTLLAERDAELQRATQIASMNAYALGRVQSSIDELGRTLTASESASAQAQVSILTRIDNGQNHSVVLRGRTTIGRDHDNDLSLAMRSVSRHHAVLIPALRTAFVQDLGSTNGVLVNQRRVRCARLEHGDVITFGGAEFRYTVTPAPTGGKSQTLSG